TCGGSARGPRTADVADRRPTPLTSALGRDHRGPALAAHEAAQQVLRVRARLGLVQHSTIVPPLVGRTALRHHAVRGRPGLVEDDPQVWTLHRDGVRAWEFDPLAAAPSILRLAVHDLTKVEPTVQDGANARCGPVSLRRCGLAVPRLAGRVDDALAVQ